MAYEKNEGGVGLQGLSKINTTFGGKLVWQLYESLHKKWCQIIQQKYLDSQDTSQIFTTLDPLKGSTIWNFMIASRG